MFVGHAALALAAKARAPRVSLGVLIAAAFGLDLLWPIFLLLGVERVTITPGHTAFTPLSFDSYPWSHSLLMALVWSAVAAGLMAWCYGEAEPAVIVSLLVLSHWILDFISHGPDLPLWPGASPQVGLGLWKSIAATLVVEGILYAAGIAIYLRTTRARDRWGHLALWSFLLSWLCMWAAGPWSPPPPSAHALARFGLGLWLFPFWAGWADRHRELRASV